MRLLRRRSLLLLALGAAAVPAPAGAAASNRAAVSRHRVRLQGEVETLSSTGPIGLAGVKDTDAGTLTGTVAGSPRWFGAVRQVVTWGRALRFHARGTAFDATGTLRFTLRGAFAANSNGKLALAGSMVVTGGTGRYHRARGTLQVTGIASVAAGSTKSSINIAGTLRYSSVR